jgi:hypothetical protein
MRLLILIGLLLGSTFPRLFAQAGEGALASNPFELRHRLPDDLLRDSGQVAVFNPFDVQAHRVPGADRTAFASTRTNGAGRSLLQLPKGKTLPKQFIFWVLLAFTACFTFSIAANRNAFWKAWRSFLSDNALNVARREAAGFVGSTPYFLMYGSFLLHAGLFLFLIVQAFNSEGTYYNFSTFVLCLLGVSSLFLSKHSLLRVVAWLFPKTADTINHYNFLIIVFNCVLGFFLVPFNFLVAFTGNQEQNLFLAFWTLGLAAIFLVYQSFRAFLLSSKFLIASQLHFLLYLCCVEIAPIVLLVKTFV